MTKTLPKKPQSAHSWIRTVKDCAHRKTGRAEAVLERLRNPCEAAKADPAVFRQGFMAALAIFMGPASAEELDALMAFSEREPRALGGEEDALPDDLLIFGLVSGDWSCLDRWPSLAARIASSATLAAWDRVDLSIVVGLLGHKKAAPAALALADALRAHCAPELADRAAAMSFKAMLRVALEADLHNASMAKRWLAKTPKSPERAAVLDAELQRAAGMNWPKATAWLLKAGAGVSPGSRERALEASVDYRHSQTLDVLLPLLAGPVDWSGCHALGMALMWGNDAAAKAMLAAGAPVDGPPSRFRKGFHGLGWQPWSALRELRPEPLAGAAIRIKTDAKKGLRWARQLIASGAAPLGCEPAKDAVAWMLSAYGDAADAEPALRAMDALGALRPEAWPVAARAAQSCARRGYADSASAIEGFSRELQARAERDVLAREMARANAKAPKGGGKGIAKAAGADAAADGAEKRSLPSARSRPRRI